MTQYARCKSCRGEIFRKTENDVWKHIHVVTDKHEAVYTEGTGLDVQRAED